EMPAAVVHDARILLERADRKSPMPDRGHHVLADAEPDHGVFLAEDLGVLADSIDTLLQPRVSKGKCLVPGEGNAGEVHEDVPAWVRRLIHSSSSGRLRRQWLRALNAGS